MKERTRYKTSGLFVALVLMFAMFCAVPFLASAAEEDQTEPIEIVEEALPVEGAAEETPAEPAENVEEALPVEGAEEALPVEATAEEALPVEGVAEEIPAEPVENNDEALPVEVEAEEVAAEPVTYTAELDTVAVKATVPADAFGEEVSLVVKQLNEYEDEFVAAEEALAENQQTYDGILAFDIHFENAWGEEVEPNGTVSVEMTAKQAAFEGVAPEAVESVQVTHISDETTVVADNDDEAVAGTVEVQATEEAVEAVDAEFVVDSFSTFVLTWGDPVQSATIHFGNLSNGEFSEFAEDKVANLDTSAASISVANTFDNEFYLGTDYSATEGYSSSATTIDQNLYKTENGWEAVHYTEDGEEQRIPIAAGSHIYVCYTTEGSGGQSGGGDNPNVPSPTTTKNVVDNGDGTYTIVLDVQGTTVEDDESHYANVLIVLDATTSMRQNNKWTYAKQAINALIEALCEGDNEGNAGKIDFSLVTFGPTAQIRTGSWGTTWTKDNETFKSWCASNSLAINTQSGTNWEAGLWVAYDALTQRPDNDPTYVIFLTDGDPYGSGRTSYNTSGTSNYHAEQAYDEAQSITGYANTKLYGIYTAASGAGDSYNRLVRVISNNGGVKTIYAQPESIESEFQAIAETIINELGSNNVSVDDGIPSLSSVSADVVGEAGGFEYQISTDGGETYSDWAEAPGASFSDDNGVTWDLSKLGTVQPGSTYRLKFTVWPSQEAYDLIADLNNSIVTMTEAELEAAGIAENDGVYTLKTNTHLKTNYTFNGEEYTDEPDELAQKAMLLPTEKISVQKIWNNLLDQQKPPTTGVKLILTKDGADYLAGENAIEVSSATSWKAENIYISNGQIKTTEDGYEILETGHDYKIVEPDEEAEGGYRWELTSDIYHPMVIDGTDTMLIQDDDATGTDGVDFYTIGSHKYVKAAGGANELHAWNDRRSWLQVEKTVTGEGAPADALFEFTVTINEANGEDVWFSAYGPDGIVKDLQTNGTPETKDSGNTGYYYKASGSPITVKIKAGWTLRFINLPSGTTYSIDETSLEDGFAFVSGEGSYTKETDLDQGTPETPAFNGSTASGTINVPNCEFYAKYTNKYEVVDFEATKVWDDDSNKAGVRPTTDNFKADVTLYQNGEPYTDYDAANYTMTDNGNNTYTIKFAELPKYVDGKEAVYTVKETTVPEGYAVSTTDAVSNGGTITNICQLTSITVTKIWNDNGYTSDRLNTEDFAAKLTLLANGTAVEGATPTVTGNQDGTYTIVYSGLQKNNEAGEAITYTVEEAAIDNYTTEGSPASDGGRIINTRQTGGLTVTKELVSDLAADADKVFTITVTLGDTSISGTYGDMTFENGVATLELKGGESATATGLPTSVTYTVEETAADGFNTSYTGQSGTIATTASAATVTNARQTGSLDVSKTVVSDLAADKDQEFTFKVTLSDTSISGKYGDMTFTNGVATVTLTHGESAKATGLPTTVGYTVKEDAASGFTTTPEGGTATGTITAEGATAAFTNTRETGNLTVTKSVESSTPSDKDKDFNFTVTLGDTTINGTYGDMTFANGVATFTLKDSESKTATGLPTTVSYTVEEAADAAFVTNPAQPATGAISKEASSVSFSNVKKEGGLIVSKTVKSDLAADKDQEFTFKVTLSDTTISGTYGDMTFTNGVATFTLKGGDTKTAKGLPANVEYTVLETAADGFTTTPEGGTATGTIVEKETATAEFTNTRETGDLTVKKSLVSDLAVDKTKDFAITVTLSDTTISGTYGDMTFANGVATFSLKGGEFKTAKGLPTTVGYTVEETALEGLVPSYEGAEGTISTTASTATVTNTRETGDLVLSKELVSDLAADKDQEFTFTVTLTDTSISKTYSGVEFKAGVATVTLKGGESKTIEGLPTTVGYTITEADAEGFQLTGKTGDEGTITTTASAAKFTNTRETGDLEVTKTVNSNRAADRTKDFSFTVTLDDKTINGTYGDMTFKDGVATFTLKGGKSATATGLPTTLGFTVTEADEKDITTTKTGDTGAISTTKSTAAFVNKHTDSEKEVISGKAETYVDGELVQAGDTLTYTITYANNTDGVATVTVEDIIPANTTYVEGSADPAASFDGSRLTWTIEGVEPGATGTVTFQVTVDDAAAGTTLENTGLVSDGENESSTNSVTTSVPVKDAKDESGASVDGGSMKVGDTITFEVNFKLTEDATSVVVTDKVPANTTLVEGSISNGGTVSDGTITWDLGALAAGDYTVSFKVTIDESAVTVDAITNTASINVNNHSEVNTNTTTTKTEKGGLTISKTVTVPEGFEIDGNKAFTFKSRQTDKNGVALTGEYAYTGSREGTLKSGDSFELKHGESITIAGLPAGAKFSIAETADAGYVADQTTITGEIPADATASATAAFVNAYTPNAVSAQLQATKALNGRNQVAGEFSFELKDSNGTVVKTATNAADGTVDFGQLSFTEPGTYTYTATEVKGDDVHVTYDSNTITYTVTVIDNGDGTLSASVTSTGNATFTNTYKGAEPVWIDPPVQKVVKAPKGTKPAVATFTFQMKAITEGAPMPEGSVDGVKTMEITGAGTKEFGKTTYTEVGTYVYEISEVKGNAEGYTYDTAIYTLTVEVTEGADGNLVAKETYTDANGKVVKSATATFTNTYTPKPPVLPQTSDDSVPTSTVIAVAGTGFALLLAGLSLRLRRNEE